ncbi:hypothetical protein FCOIX_5632 [Fusarium coicis]|nr:hypothetical protein FCOIX_5632 [Fusarium coicis]
MKNQADQGGSDTESHRGSGSRSAPGNTSNSESYSDSSNSNLRVNIATPPFAGYMTVNDRASFKQYLAVTAAYSIGKSLLDTWNSSAQARERRRRREAEQREIEAREAREAAEERERRERVRREALERLMQDFQHEDYAPTGASEVTLERHRYPDPIHAGFICQQLYAYDLVVLVHDSTLTRSDVRILQVCHLMKKPWLAVRTKCDMHIRNYEIERDWDTETAKGAFLAEVQDDVSKFTQQAEASETDFATEFRDFVVSAPGIRRVIRGRTSGPNAANAFIDEVEFLRALGLPYGVPDDMQ